MAIGTTRFVRIPHAAIEPASPGAYQTCLALAPFICHMAGTFSAIDGHTTRRETGKSPLFLANVYRPNRVLRSANCSFATAPGYI